MAAETKAILVVDDEPSMCEMLEVAIRKWGHRVKIARNLREAMAAVERGRIDCVLSDIKLPDGSGVDLVTRIKTLPENPPILLMTAFGNTEAAVQAMRLGAFYYITKPFKLEELRQLIDRALSEQGSKKDSSSASAGVVGSKKEPSIESIIGKSKPMKQLFELIERVSKTKTNILITGESGTGKELVARAIHYSGPMKTKPFVAVNCGAIPETLIESELFGHKKGSFTGAVVDKEGLFQVADGGTIFLDEVGELPMSMQVKLLRVIQERSMRPVGSTENVKVDVRIISATNRNLEEGVARGIFREDLYYRLNVIHIRTPHLRERKEDIIDLVQYFIRKYSLSMGKQVTDISDKALQALLSYDFPGNVRELENIIERAIALEGTSQISFESLPNMVQAAIVHGRTESDAMPGLGENYVGESKGALKHAHQVNPSSGVNALDKGPVDLEKIVGELEKEYILKALEKAGGVKKKAAQLLGITFRSFRYRISKYGVDDPEGDVGDSDE